MKKPIIAVDIDDTLADYATAFIEFTNRTWGTSLTPNDYSEDWSKVWQVDYDEVVRRASVVNDASFMATFAPISDAYEVLRGLKESFILVAATSRRRAQAVMTAEWLDTHYGGLFDDVHHSGIYDDQIEAATFSLTKTDVLRQINADFLIDDQLKHCLGAAEHGIKAVLFGNHAWNQHDALPQHVSRCADWQAVGRYFKNI